MLGTGPFAAPTFAALFGTRHEVAALVTKPPREAKSRSSLPPNRMRQIAAEHGTPIFDPEDINAEEARQWLKELRPHLLVVADYGKLLSPQTLAVAPLGGINLHGSLLPKYRGAAPINWAIYHGETETGVTVIHMTPRLDAGPCLARAATPIRPEETAEQLEPRLAESGAPLVCRVIDELAAGTAAAIAQDNTLASKAPRLQKADGAIDWSRTAEQIHNQVRAMQPWPKCYAYWHRPDGEPLRLIVDTVAVVEGSGKPGIVLEAGGNRLIVAAAAQAVSLLCVQPAGKRVMAAGEFLRGHAVQAGQRFGAGIDVDVNS